MVILKSRVRGISDSFSIQLLEFTPSSLRRFDVPLLSRLGAAAEQYDELPALLAEVDPVAGAVIDSELMNPRTDALHVGGVALLQPRESHCDVGGGA